MQKTVGSQLAAMMGNCYFLTTAMSSCLYNGGNFGPMVSAIFPSLLIQLITRWRSGHQVHHPPDIWWAGTSLCTTLCEYDNLKALTGSRSGCSSWSPPFNFLHRLNTSMKSWCGIRRRTKPLLSLYYIAYNKTSAFDPSPSRVVSSSSAALGDQR